MILKNISPLPQLVNTINWKEIVNSWSEFETDKWEQLLRMYPELFEEVNHEAKKDEVKETKKK